MCELLGLAFNQPVRASLSFRGFRHRGAENPHGWGLAIYPEGEAGRARIYKEAESAEYSALADELRDSQRLESSIFIGHVRFGNVGGQSFDNTHPFSREIRGRDFVLAHNGTLRWPDAGHGLDGSFTPVGTTDSEHALCALLTWMIDEEIPFTGFRAIEERLRFANNLGTMNLLFSDGTHLFAYHDHRGYNGLCYTHRRAPFPSVRLEDEDWAVRLADQKHPDQRGYVIATRPLTDEPWTDFEPGSLMVFKDGELVYPD